MKKINIKLPHLKIGSFFSYVFLTLLTSLLVVIVLISLPLTENISDNIYYNLINKNDFYWEKEYILTLDTTDIPDSEKNSSIERTRNILSKRLNKADVEEASIYAETLEGEDILRVVVKTSINESLIDNLIQNRYYVQIVTRKEDVDFDDEDNPYTYLMGENYDPTEYTGSFFRNILLTDLKNSSGEYSYFAIFKTYFWDSNKFQSFLKTHEGEYIGVDIDGYVTPYYVDTEDPKVFAISMYGGKEQSELIDILYNSGEIPLSFTTESGISTTINDESFNYINLSIGLLTATLIIYISLIFILKENPKLTSLSLFSTLLTISGWITYLKLSSTPIDLWMLSIECIFSAVLIYVLVNNKESRIPISISLILNFFIFLIFGLGYMRIFGRQMILVLLISWFSIAFGQWYIDNLKKTLTR